MDNTTPKLMIGLNDVKKSFNLNNKKVDNLKSLFTNPLSIFGGGTHKLEVLKGLSLKINEGEIVGIIGRNGSGKSTLLKILAGIYSPDQGSYEVNGNLVPFLELGVGFNPDLSARDNIFLNGTILGMKRKYLKDKVDHIIKFAELDEFIDTPVKNFSSGMLVRLAFAIAVQSNADIYLLDEILAVGDAGFQQKSFEILRNFKQEKKTVILVSHDLDSISNFCTRVVYIRKGKIVKDGNPQEVINEYLVDTFKNDNAEESDVYRWGSGEIRIRDLKLLRDNEETNSFKSGEEIKLEIEFERNKEVDKLNIGVGIYDVQSNFYIWGGNTQMDKYEIKKDKLILKLNSSVFSKGNYYINLVAFGEIEKKAYDFVLSYKNFYVVSDEKYRGNLNLKHDWD